jgi:hypothetical protein
MKVFIESFGTDFDVHFSENAKINVRGVAEVRIGKYTTAEISLAEDKGYTWMYLSTKEEDGKEIIVINDLEEEIEIDMEGKEELTIRKLDFEIKLKIDKISKQYFEILRKNKEVAV